MSFEARAKRETDNGTRTQTIFPKTFFFYCHYFQYAGPNNICITEKLKEARNRFFGIGVDLFKSVSRMEGFLRFPSYHTTFSTYDQILCFGWFPSNSCYHNNGDAKHFVLNNVDYLEI